MSYVSATTKSTNYLARLMGRQDICPSRPAEGMRLPEALGLKVDGSKSRSAIKISKWQLEYQCKNSKGIDRNETTVQYKSGDLNSKRDDQQMLDCSGCNQKLIATNRLYRPLCKERR